MTPHARPRCLALFAALALCGAARPARAEDPEALLREGLRLRREGRDAEALAEFRRAHEIAPTPRAAAQMGLAEQALGRWIDAEIHVGEALVASRDRWVDQNRPYLEQALGTIRRHIGAVEIDGGPRGAEVRLGDRRLGTLPLPGPVRADEGEIDLRVAAPGHQPATRRITVRSGETTRETVSLVALAETGPPAAAPRSTGPPAATLTAAPPARLAASRSAAHLGHIVGWATIAAGAALAGAGAGLRASGTAPAPRLVPGLLMAIGAGAMVGGVTDVVLAGWLARGEAGRPVGVTVSFRR